MIDTVVVEVVRLTTRMMKKNLLGYFLVFVFVVAAVIWDVLYLMF